MTAGLSDDEKKALGVMIGAGLAEYAMDAEGDVASACRKLGVVPVDWHGHPMLREEEVNISMDTERENMEDERGEESGTVGDVSQEHAEAQRQTVAGGDEEKREEIREAREAGETVDSDDGDGE